MGIPSTIDDFLALIRKSSVVDRQRLDDYLPTLRSAPQHLGKFAGILVRDGILTHFQAEQFLQGKWHGFVIGKYKVLERLGWGGMGNVYLCEHTFMRRRVAVKVLATAHAHDPANLQRFYREARAAAALDHPNIVRAFDVNRDGKLHFLVMEYVDGASLQEIITKHGPMDATRAAHYLAQSAVGLQHAHATAGLVHRDIKPANILVDRNGVVKILDMGLARFSHDEDDVITKKDTFVGTADYLAPEQALDSHRADIRADIYSLGATFYFILSGNTPFPKGTAAQKLIWHQTRQPKPIKQIRADVPAGLAAILEKMMVKNPADRYHTPNQLLDALMPWVQTPIGPPPEKEMPRLCRAAKGSEAMITLSATPAPAAVLRPASPYPATKTPCAAAPAEQVNVVKITPVPSCPPPPTIPENAARPGSMLKNDRTTPAIVSPSPINVEHERPQAETTMLANSGNRTSVDETEQLRRQVQLLIQQNNRLRQERDTALAQLQQLPNATRTRGENARAIQVQS